MKKISQPIGLEFTTPTLILELKLKIMNDGKPFTTFGDSFDLEYRCINTQHHKIFFIILRKQNCFLQDSNDVCDEEKNRRKLLCRPKPGRPDL